VFLGRLFALEGVRMTGHPRAALRPAIDGYEIRDLRVTLPGGD
jgi:hypothetical protein